MNNASTFLRSAALAAVLSVGLIAGCGGEQKIAPVPVGEMEEYRDAGIGYHLKYPRGWAPGVESGRLSIFSTQDGYQKFLDPMGPYGDAVLVRVDVRKTTDPAATKADYLKEFAEDGRTMAAEQPVTVAGSAGWKTGFRAPYSSKVAVNGHLVGVAAESLYYFFTFSGFNQQYEAYAGVFDAILGSFEFPKPAAAGVDATLPAETFSSYDAKLFTFEYPDNFNFTGAPKGKNEMTVELRGYRQDCTVRFDVFSAQNLPLEKVFEQNKGKYRARSTGNATIGGQPAMYVDYSPAAQVDSRAYFIVKDGKVYRVTLNWFKGQAEAYRAAYARVTGSITFK
jgi:hypothetical protein